MSREPKSYDEAMKEIKEIRAKVMHDDHYTQLDCPECGQDTILMPDDEADAPDETHCHQCGETYRFYECERCGQLIIEGKYCAGCAHDWAAVTSSDD